MRNLARDGACDMAQDIEIECGDVALERGCILRDDVIKARLYGPAGAPVIVVLGGISE